MRAEFEDVLRFWLDRGVDGFRDRRGARHDQGRGAAGRRLQHDDHRPAPGRAARQGPAALLRPGRGARDLPRLAADPGQLPRRPDGGRRGVGRDRRSDSPATSARTSCTRRSASTSSTPPGRPTRSARSSTPRSPRRRSSARRPPGCCPTTTSARHVTRLRRRRPSRGCAGPGRPRLLMLALPGSRLPLPGRGAGPAGGARPAGRAAPGPGVPAHRREPRRLPGADPVERRAAPYGFGPRARLAGCRTRRPGRGCRSQAQPGAPARRWSSTAPRCGSAADHPALAADAAGSPGWRPGRACSPSAAPPATPC